MITLYLSYRLIHIYTFVYMKLYVSEYNNACVLDLFGLYGALSSPAPRNVTLDCFWPELGGGS